MIILGVGAILYQFVDWGMTVAVAILAVLTTITVVPAGPGRASPAEAAQRPAVAGAQHEE